MTDTSTQSVADLLDGVTPGPWRRETMGGASTVLTPIQPPRNDRRCENTYGYRGDEFCIAYPFLDDRSGGSFDVRLDFVCMDHADAHFIAAARELVPALLAERDEALARAEKAEAERDALIGAALEAIAVLPTPTNEDVMRGHEDAYRAVEAIANRTQEKTHE